MTSMNVTERARRAEDDYFRRRDAELMERALRARREEQQPPAPSVNLEERALADALGVHDAVLVAPLYAAGFRAGHTALLDWMPAIDVAWIDDVDVHERHELKLQIAADPDGAAAGVRFLSQFLFVQPSEELMAAVRGVLRHQLHAMDPAARRERFLRILDRCETVGEASGGLLGMGALSLAERRHISAIRAGLADVEAYMLGESYEFPH